MHLPLYSIQREKYSIREGIQMPEFSVYFDTIEQIRQVVDLAMVQPFAVYVGKGDHWVSAKSFIGMFSLDLRQSQLLRGECSEEDFRAFRSLVEAALGN